MLLVLGRLLWPAYAQAQTGAFALDVSTPEQQPRGIRVMQALDEALDARGLGAPPFMSSRQTHEQRGPMSRSDAAWTALKDSAHAVLESLVYGADADALRVGRVALTEASSQLPLLGARAETAQDLGDLCLLLVRAELHAGHEPGADALALECLRLVPDLSASPQRHPESVIALLARTRAEALPRHGAALAVDLRGGAIEPCITRIQGRPIGSFPLAGTRVAPGEYYVQVDCGDGAGRVHRVEVHAGETLQLAVSPSLERVASFHASFVQLQYPSGDAHTARRVLDAIALPSWLELDTVWLVKVEADGTTTLFVLRARANREAELVGPVAIAYDPTGISPTNMANAVSLLLDPEDTTARSARAPAASTSTPRRRAAIGVGVVGGAAVIASWALLGRWLRLDAQLGQREALDGSYASAAAKRDDLMLPALLTGATGYGLVLSSTVVWLPERATTPWWAWLAGGAGLTVAATGTWLWVEDGSLERDRCVGDPCQRTRRTLPLAPLLVMQGATLLGLPVIYGSRALFRAHTTTVSWRGSELTVSGRF